MIKILLTGFLIAATFCAYSQGSGFLILKKNDRTIKTFIPGQQIQFTTFKGAYRDAEIVNIKNDSVYLREYKVQQIPTVYGGYITDTITSYYYQYHYNEISSFPKAAKGFSLGGSGASLFGGGLLLSLGSGVVWLADKEKFSPALLGIGLGGVVVGYTLLKIAAQPVKIGKKYQLKYFDTQNSTQ